VHQEQTVTPAPGWYRDPYFLHHERYWDNGWTDLVRRVTVESPVLPARPATPTIGPSQMPSKATAPSNAKAPSNAGPAGKAEAVTAAAALAARRPPGDPRTGKDGVVHDDDTLAVSAVSRVWPVPPEARNDDTSTVGAVRVEPDTLAVPAVTRLNGSTPLPQGLPRDSGGALTEEEAEAVRTRSRRRRLALVAAGLVVVAVVVASLLVTGGSSGNGGGSGHGRAGNATATAADDGAASTAPVSPSAAESVTTDASDSVQKGSVEVSVALVSIGSSPSTSQHISGSGQFLLNSGLGTLSVTGSGATAQGQKFVFQGHTVFVNVTNSPVPGKSWVVASTNDLPALGPGSSLSDFMEEMGNPGTLVLQLTATPLTVASLGAATIDGVPVRRYEVTFSVSAAGSTSASLGTNTTEEVDVSADKLVQQIVIPVRVSGQSVQQNIVVTFSHYGKAITVDSPPFNELISLSQYLTGPVPPSA
jgi:hypothetical protein